VSRLLLTELIISNAGVPEDNPIVIMIKQRVKGAEQLCPSSAPGSDIDIMALENEADAELKQGNIDRAIVTLTRVMAMRKVTLKKLKAAKQDSSSEMRATACTLEKFGDVLILKGDNENAVRSYKDAIKLLIRSGAGEDSGIVKVIHAKLDKLPAVDVSMT